MIRVNLIDSYIPGQGVGGAPAVVGADELKEIKNQAFARLFIIFLPTLGMYVYEYQHIPSLQDRIVKLTSEIEKVKGYNAKQAPAVSEIKKFKEDEKKIQDRIAVLDRLSKERSNEIKVLHLVQQTIPEKAWLTKLDIQDGKANISGLALNDSDISIFMETLSKSVFLSDVSLVSASEILLDGAITKQFEINCVLDKQK